MAYLFNQALCLSSFHLNVCGLGTPLPLKKREGVGKRTDDENGMLQWMKPWLRRMRVG